MPEKTSSLWFSLSPLEAVMDLNGAHGPWTKKGISTDLMQSDVVKRVAQRAGCHPAFHARVFFFTICAPQNCWIDGVFRFDPSGVLRCKHFIRGFLVVYYVECALSWINCGPRFRNTICYQKVSLKKGKTLWTSFEPTKAVFERMDVPPYSQNFFQTIHHEAGDPCDFWGYLFSHPTISCSSGTCDFIQLCFSVKSMLLFVWPKRESIWSMSSHERQLCGGASSSSKSDVKLLVNRDAQRITVNHGESRWITLVFCREPVSYGRITPNHAQSRSITLPIVKGIL